MKNFKRIKLIIFAVILFFMILIGIFGFLCGGLIILSGYGDEISFITLVVSLLIIYFSYKWRKKLYKSIDKEKKEL